MAFTMYGALIWGSLAVGKFGVGAIAKLFLKLVLCGAVGFVGIIIGSVFDKPFPESNWRHDIPSTVGAIAGVLGSAWMLFLTTS